MSTRRFFVRNSALAMAGAGAAPQWLARAFAAVTPEARKKTLVTIFQRGAADGLNVVVPHGEEAYYRLRPTIAIPRPTSRSGRKDDAALDLDGFFGLHPSLGPLKAWYDQGHLAVVDAVGSPDPTRSHFDAQDYMESGTPGRKATADGWMDRASTGAPRKAGPLEGIAHRPYAPGGAAYPRGLFGQSLRQIAHAIKSGVGVEMAFADIGGWDHHVYELGARPGVGALADRLREFGEGLSAFWQDMGDRMDDVVIVTLSEFGRTAKENGSRGTDHGHANCMFVLGGRVKGGKVYGKWPGLEEEQLHEGRGLARTTDFRDVLGELVSGHLGHPSLEIVFPGYGPKALGLL